MLCQWHKRLLLRHSYLSRRAIFYSNGQRRSDLCRSISTAFVLQAPLNQVCDQEWRATPTARGWIVNSGRRSKSQRLLRHREGGVLLTQQRFASDDKNYRRSEFFLSLMHVQTLLSFHSTGCIASPTRYTQHCGNRRVWTRD